MYYFLPPLASSSKTNSRRRSRGVLRRQLQIKIEQLHKRVGHANITNVLEGLHAGTVSGYAVTANHIIKKWTLQQCILGKSKLPSFPRASKEKGKELGDYLVTDIMGPLTTETLLGEKYALTYTDWYSRYSWTYLLRVKSDVLPQLKHLLQVVSLLQPLY
jgi:hypothetical protein